LVAALAIAAWLVWNYYTQSPGPATAKSAPSRSASPQVSGSILQLNVRDNQLVKAGDVLFRIDDTPIKSPCSTPRRSWRKPKRKSPARRQNRKSRQRCQPSSSSFAELYLGRRFRKRQYRAEYRHHQPRSRQAVVGVAQARSITRNGSSPDGNQSAG
jgi:multidrug resistance efflux pump